MEVFHEKRSASLTAVAGESGGELGEARVGWAALSPFVGPLCSLSEPWGWRSDTDHGGGTRVLRTAGALSDSVVVPFGVSSSPPREALLPWWSPGVSEPSHVKLLRSSRTPASARACRGRAPGPYPGAAEAQIRHRSEAFVHGEYPPGTLGLDLGLGSEV